MSANMRFGKRFLLVRDLDKSIRLPRATRRLPEEGVRKTRAAPLKRWLLMAVVIGSLLLTAYSLGHRHQFRQHLESAAWIGFGLLITETFFIAGALLMAVGAGESIVSFKRIRHWPRHMAQLRRDARLLAERLLADRLFAVGFWVNCIGAIGTSLILITAIMIFAPYTGLGLLIVIVIDLAATFGWRIPLEITRRRMQKYGAN